MVSGSHGELYPAAVASLAGARAAVFNDAGIGLDQAVMAVTVDCETARIGDATSALETGEISAANPAAQKAGADVGMMLVDWLGGLER